MKVMKLGIGEYHESKGFGEHRELRSIGPFILEAQEWLLSAPNASLNSPKEWQAYTIY